MQNFGQPAIGGSAASGLEQCNPSVVVVVARFLARLLGPGDDFVDQVGLGPHQPLHEGAHLFVLIGGVGDGPGEDERSPRLVDEDRVGFIDDGVVEFALHQVFE